MPEYLAAVDHLVPDLPYNWETQVWSDEVVMFLVGGGLYRPGIAQFPFVPGFFVVEWLTDAYHLQPTSSPISGPYKTLNAAYAAWKLMQ